jgi:hypothetical protein
MPWLSGQATNAYSIGAEEERNSQGGSSQKELEEGTWSVASSLSQPRLWPCKSDHLVGHDVEAAAARQWSSDHRQTATARTARTASPAPGSARVADPAIQPVAGKEISRIALRRRSNGPRRSQRWSSSAGGGSN